MTTYPYIYIKSSESIWPIKLLKKKAESRNYFPEFILLPQSTKQKY